MSTTCPPRSTRRSPPSSCTAWGSRSTCSPRSSATTWPPGNRAHPEGARYLSLIIRPTRSPALPPVSKAPTLPLSPPATTTLANGVTLLNAPLPSRNVGIFLIVRAGSRDETAETAGLAHYLEHMFYKGTERRPTTQQITREIDRLGASTNAYTDTEEVGYYAEGPASAMLQLADIVTDMLSRP
ncbi:MAG TPA: hypothetical protein DCX12_11600, partial [Chloroflexi bacterium]|nr:hypothetical protein [Chloroflexota bacterium]HBV93413.1 hypothetical protein [Chloroflexota bacterium]